MRNRHYVAVAAIGLSLLSAAPAFAQFVQQGAKVTGTGGVVAPQLGGVVALSADGNTAFVSGSQDNNGTGALWIFTRSGGAWTQLGSKVVPTPAATGAAFGGSIALSTDGTTAVIGGYTDNGGVGAAWIFLKVGSTWAQQGPKLVGTLGVGRSNQGTSVAISADGNTVLVGGSEDSYQNGAPEGASWVFTRSNGVWTQEGSKLVGTGATGAAGQGMAVALSADGNTAVVGGSADNSNAGAVWTFTRSGGVWTQQGSKLTGTGASGAAAFGGSVALSADGNTLIAGGRTDNSSAGAVWAFARNGSTWTQQGSKLVGSGAIGGAQQGWSVGLSSDGTFAIVGGPGDGGGGAAWGFVRNGDSWSQVGAKLVGTNGYSTARQGSAVALASDGRTAIVGGPLDFMWQGAVWIFTRTGDLLHAGDQDGDLRSDITVYNTASGLWSSITSASGFNTSTNRSWGGPSYAAAPGDYDGDGKTDLGLYDASTGFWYVLLSGSNYTTTLSKNAGGPGWQAVPRDFDGDGKTDFVVYNTTTGQWWGLTSTTNYTPALNVNWGGSGYVPVAADYDGDGKADLGVYNVATGLWTALLSSSSYTTTLARYCGGSGWAPVPADYDGDGKADLVVYAENPGQWYGLKSSGNYATIFNMLWGGSNYQPVKGDFDGDGKADLATYVQSTGDWYILLSGANYTTAIVRAWGGPGSVAIPQFP